MDESRAVRRTAEVDVRALAEEVGDLRGVIEAQAKTIELLQRRLGPVDRAGDAPASIDREAATVEPSSSLDLGSPTSRRSLMGKGAAAAAGAAIAGTVLNVASAPPAAAAQGTFDGNPAVLGTANPTSGVGVRGLTDTGIGVRGTADQAEGTGVGVQGISEGDGGAGVQGIASSDSGNPVGVSGRTLSAGGTGVVGSGPTTGVWGNSESGIGVYGTVDAGTGIVYGVWGGSSSTSGIGVYGQAGANSGNVTGVRGDTPSTSGKGVVGLAAAATGSTVGVDGSSFSNSGVGVAGTATASTGGTVGVAGSAASSSGVGVLGTTSAAGGNAIGVSGTSSSTGGVGMSGNASAATGATIGVRGNANSGFGIGVFGSAGSLAGSSGTGMYGSGGNTGVEANSNRSQLKLTGTPAAPLGVAQARTAGEIVLDTNKDLWLCVASGTPGTWRRVSGPSTAGAFVPLPAPVRVYDSRPGFNPNIGPKSKLVAATPRTVDCTLNSSGVPVGASGVLVNLVSTGTSAFGDMAIYKDGIPYPGTSNLNFFGFTVAVTTFSAVSTAAKVAVRSNVACDVVLDVLGYYQ